MGINAYKNIQQVTNTPAQKNYQLFNSIFLWLNDSVTSSSHSRKMECLLNAQNLLTTTIERIPAGIPDEEANPLMHILLTINIKFNKCFKDSSLINQDYLKDVFEVLNDLKGLYK